MLNMISLVPSIEVGTFIAGHLRRIRASDVFLVDDGNCGNRSVEFSTGMTLEVAISSRMIAIWRIRKRYILNLLATMSHENGKVNEQIMTESESQSSMYKYFAARICTDKSVHWRIAANDRATYFSPRIVNRDSNYDRAVTKIHSMRTIFIDTCTDE